MNAHYNYRLFKYRYGIGGYNMMHEGTHAFSHIYPSSFGRCARDFDKLGVLKIPRQQKKKPVKEIQSLSSEPNFYVEGLPLSHCEYASTSSTDVIEKETLVSIDALKSKVGSEKEERNCRTQFVK